MIRPPESHPAAIWIPLVAFKPEDAYWIIRAKTADGSLVELGCGLDDLERIHACARHHLQMLSMEKAREE